MAGTDIHIGIDVGGTFTDLAVSIPADNRLIRHKLSSTPASPDQAIIDGIAAVLSDHGLDPAHVVRLSHGTTVGTNALIQKRCGTVAVVTSEGFRDLLEIGRQSRPQVYDIHKDYPRPLVSRDLRFEVGERVLADGTVYRPLDEAGLREVAARLAAEKVDCVVVCFLHSYAYPDHEDRAVSILRESLPDDVEVLSSSSVYPEFREFERFSTAVLNGALLTVMNAYMDRFTRAVKAQGVPVAPTVSQSSGGLMSVDMARRLPIRASLSGPAAGVRGTAFRAQTTGHGNVVTLDMGGTSADVSLLRDGQPTEVQERTLAGYPLRLPAIDVNAVGAGGGSIAWIDLDGLLKVGPRSAGAVPGPACYDQGGTEATVTDANVVLGRLNGEALLDGRMPIRKALSEKSIAVLGTALGMDMEQTALGIVRVVSAIMVKAIRTISIERGHNPADFSLFVYGGAGPLHAVDVAQELDIGTVVVPPSPGILCAEGLLNSQLTLEFVKTVLGSLEDGAADAIEAARQELMATTQAWFEQQGVAAPDRRLLWSAGLRYQGQNYELTVPMDEGPVGVAMRNDLIDAFHEAHERNYGFASRAETIQFVNLKVKALGLLEQPPLPTLENTVPADPVDHRQVLFSADGWIETPIFRRDSLGRDQTLHGPAVIDQLDATTVVFPGNRCIVDRWGNLVITVS